jgi:predicted ATP-binding protein involved in virulence
MRRIIALAYLLVWAWEEHRKASTLLGEATTNQVVFLVDEIESHLHPRWQFSIIGSLLKVMTEMAPSAQVQVLTATHSPQVLASVEPYFDPVQDAWFDLDYEHDDGDSDVTLTKRHFERHGEVSNWLTSEAFDLSSARSPDIAALLVEASALLESTSNTSQAVSDMHQRLLVVLNPKDSFLFRWRAIAEKKGLLP